MSNTTDFWDVLLKDAHLSGETGSIDSYLSGKAIGGEQVNSVRQLTDKFRQSNMLSLPIKAGTRVSFAGNLGAVLTYSDPPNPKAQGSVVTVKSANGPVTHHEDMVFVQWDDGQFRSVHAQHLRLAEGRPKQGLSKATRRVASLGDLTEFLKVAEDTLIHRSTRDLWSFRQEGVDYVIERLFDDTGEPLKG